MSPEARATPFGTTADGSAVTRYDLDSADGSGVSVLDYGAVVLEVRVPDRTGRVGNVALGLPALADYERNEPYFGAVVGRVANRIARARITIDGRTRALPANEGPTHLHGGPGGFHARIWEAVIEAPPGGGEAAVVLRRISPDGEEGYPGTLDVTVRIAWSEGHELRFAYRARTDAPTLLNPTHHGYWNLAGEGSGSVDDHELSVEADRFVAVDEASIPTGERPSVAGTPLDLRRPRRLGDAVRGDHPQLRRVLGVDHTFVLRDVTDEGAPPREAARLVDPRSGRFLTVRTTEPGLHVYAGNRLDGSLIGPSGRAYRQGDGVALETQRVLTAPDVGYAAPVLLRPGETYRSETVYAFGADAGRA